MNDGATKAKQQSRKTVCVCIYILYITFYKNIKHIRIRIYVYIHL